MTTGPTSLRGSGPAAGHRLRRRLGAGLLGATALVGAAGALGACGGSGTTAAPTDATGAGGPTAAATQVLPVGTDPISNDATERTLTIDSVLVENNEDGAGNAVDDHLEITVGNSSGAELGGFEVFYTYADPTEAISESYYAELPADFTVAPGASRVIHFDDSGAPDHFPVNAYSLYHTDSNALDVTVEVSAVGAAPVTATVQKDAGGAEVPD